MPDFPPDPNFPASIAAAEPSGASFSSSDLPSGVTASSLPSASSGGSAAPLPTLARDARPLGAHMPTAGGLHKALLGGQAIGCTAVQLFTSNPRQWNAPPLDPAVIETFQRTRDETGVPFVIAHDSYLINLAAPDAVVLDRSLAAFRGELDRAQELGLAWVVTHMGAHLEQGEAAALERLADSLRRILDATDALGYSVGVALETTAGQGTGLGWRFEQIGQVMQAVGPHPRLGVCLDTCHVFVAGYDLREADAYEQTWADFDAHIGLDRLKVIHANDAKKPLGSRVDRHEHLGQGEIGLPAFQRLATDPRLSHIPLVIETPDSETMHAVNLALLRGLASGEVEVSREILVTVHLFGHYSDFGQGEPLQVALAPDSDLAALADQLATLDMRFADLARRVRFAVNEEYAPLETRLEDGHVVAVLPPMSGG